MEYKEHTIGWWLNGITNEEIRKQALANAEKEGTLGKVVRGLWTALDDGFTWASTPQGGAYWSKFAKSIQ